MTACPVATRLNRRATVRFGSGGIAAVLGLRGMRPTMAKELTTLESNKAIARRLFEEGVNGRNAAVQYEVYAGEAVDGGRWARRMPGPAGMPLTIAEFHAAFPDIYVSVEQIIANEDLVATRVAWHGTHPPAGTHVVGQTIHIFRIANARIVEQWSEGWEWLAKLDNRPVPRISNPLAGT